MIENSCICREVIAPGRLVGNGKRTQADIADYVVVSRCEKLAALVRIDPKVIKKRGRIPKNGSIFFTIFQTFMTKTADFDSAQSAQQMRAEPISTTDEG